MTRTERGKDNWLGVDCYQRDKRNLTQVLVSRILRICVIVNFRCLLYWKDKWGWYWSRLDNIFWLRRSSAELIDYFVGLFLRIK